jgi:hypothetical protein
MNRLSLNRETVRELGGVELQKAAGGQISETCYIIAQTWVCSALCTELPTCLCSSLPCGGGQ